MDLIKLAKNESDKDKKNKQLLEKALIASGVMAGITGSQAVQSGGPSVLLSPEAFIGGLGGGTIGGLGTYGVSRLLGGKHSGRDALNGAVIGTMLGYTGGAFTNAMRSHK